MKKQIFLCIACDTDPDVDLPVHKASRGREDDYWHGVARGIDLLRSRLRESDPLGDGSDIPITWLLRSDRQIRDIYGDPAFCFKRYSRIWEKEAANGSEIGWHPHLFAWNERLLCWQPNLHSDDDIQTLGECLASIRAIADIRSVRTGWDYCSNALMNFFGDSGLRVDASALPGCIYDNEFYHNWHGTPRTPFMPSRSDYRRSVLDGETPLDIVEIPSLVKKLNFPSQLGRYCVRHVRRLRTGRNHRARPQGWSGTQWQAVKLTSQAKDIQSAISQTLAAYHERGPVFITTYFHTCELLPPHSLNTIVRNVCGLIEHIKKGEYQTVFPTTLSTAAEKVDITLR